MIINLVTHCHNARKASRASGADIDRCHTLRDGQCLFNMTF
jgi:hypothetical protein